jgi:uncharacterized membrane protein
MKIAKAILTGVLVVLYPVAIWIGLAYFSARTVGLFIVALLVPLAVLRFRKAKREDLWAIVRIPLLILALVTLGVVFDDPRFVLALPVLINVALLITFALSLRGETIIERFAKMQHPEGLDAARIAHCRQVTVLWCAFFVLNAAAAGLLGLFAPTAWWAAYTGGIAYALMGMMFAGEYVVRHARFRNYGDGLHDRLLSRIFPPTERKHETHD